MRGWRGFCLVMAAGWPALAVQRFPQPEFETGYAMPTETMPGPELAWWGWADVLVLLAALAAATWLGQVGRSRRGLFWLSVGCLAWFGFVRGGCVCAVGAIQNVAWGAANEAVAVPWAVLAIFALPLLFALFAGRSFCAAVCPLGCLQDVVVVRPQRVAGWLAAALGLLPVVYLAVAVVLAATTGRFVICRYDPFVSVFRLSGHWAGLGLGVGFLALGTVVARPYCRFVCPYGVLLGWASWFAWRRVSITPDVCVQCRLCEDVCPFGAIQVPVAVAEGTVPGRRRLAWLLAVLPVAAMLGGAVGYGVGGRLARADATVRLSDRLRLEEAAAGAVAPSLETEAFRGMGQAAAVVHERAATTVGQVRWGGAWAGALVAVVVMWRLLALSVRRTRTEYRTHPTECLSCGRCFAYCPREQLRRRGTTAEEDG